MALTALFGEFVAHDLAHTPRMDLPNGERLKCCDVPFEQFHPECFPIRAENEIGGCMEYARSAPHPGNMHQVRLDCLAMHMSVSMCCVREKVTRWTPNALIVFI